MAESSVKIYADVGGSMTLRKFSEVISERISYLNETSRQSITASALQILRSIRSITLVAKASKIKPNLEKDNTLYPSYLKKGTALKVPCLRYKGSDKRYTGTSKVVFAETPARGMEKSWQVYKTELEHAKKPKSWLIAAPTQASAKAKAKKLLTRLALRYAGLAKRAISVLMMKTYNKGVSDNVPAYVTSKAQQLTRKNEVLQKSSTNGGGVYALKLLDNLNYALLAAKGGKAQVDLQLKKAMNKIVSVINLKMKDTDKLFGPQKLQTPFPELTRKR